MFRHESYAYLPEGLLCLPNDWCHKSRRWQHITIMNSPNGSLTEPMMISPRVWVVCFFQKPSEKELAPRLIFKKYSISVIMMFWPYQLMKEFVHQDYHKSIKNKLANEVRGLLMFATPLEPPNERSYFIRDGLENGKTPTFRTWILRSLDQTNIAMDRTPPFLGKMFAHRYVKAMLFYGSVDPTKTNKSHLFFTNYIDPPKKWT